jgi:hypothetical protein
MTPSWPRLVRTLLPLLVLGASAEAQARVDGSSAYSKAQTYSGALRYVRVDLGYEVVEKDPDAAYLIFKYTAQGQAKASAVTGTLEVIEVSGGGVKLIVSLPRMPEYHERIFRDGLLKKLRDEYGSPPPAAKKPPAEKPGEKPPTPPEAARD